MRAAPLLALLVLAAGPLAAATPARGPEVQALRAERDARAQEASRLADEIALLKSGTPGPRAGAELERALRAFDRVARALDELERRLARLETAAGRGPLGGLDEADLRPLLDIAIEPGDFGPAFDAKRALLQAESARGVAQAERLAAALRVLALRVEAKQRLAREAESARRDVGPALLLLQRQADELKLELRELQSARAALERRQAELARELAIIEQRLAEALGRAGAGSTSP